jgi:broad specificity phosphatase PhoE
LAQRLLLLARHGETDWNARGRLQGHTDIALNEKGESQARALAERLRDQGVVAITTSDLSRARETGRIVGEVLGVSACQLDEDLRERAFGVFEGLTRDECASRHPEAWRAWLEQTQSPEGGEARELAVARMTRALDRAWARGDEGAELIVSHGGVMRLWVQEQLGTTIALIGNGTVYRVSREGGLWVTTRWE